MALARRTSFALLSLSFLAVAVPAVAAPRHWNGKTGDKQWGTKANWDEGASPTKDDDVFIQTSPPQQVQLASTANPPLTSLTLTNGNTLSATVDNTWTYTAGISLDGTLQLTPQASLTLAAGGLDIKSGGTLELTPGFAPLILQTPLTNAGKISVFANGNNIVASYKTFTSTGAISIDGGGALCIKGGSTFSLQGGSVTTKGLLQIDEGSEIALLGGSIGPLPAIVRGGKVTFGEAAGSNPVSVELYETNNFVDGTIDADCSVSLIPASGNATDAQIQTSLINRGSLTLQVTGGGTSLGGPKLTNEGKLISGGSAITAFGDLTVDSVINTGTIQLSSSLNLGKPGGKAINQGTISLSNGTVLASASNLANLCGSIEGNGIVQVADGALFATKGKLEPGGVGVAGALTLSPANGTMDDPNELAIDLIDSDSRDMVTVTPNLALGGALRVRIGSKFDPTSLGKYPDQALSILSGQSVSGTFSNLGSDKRLKVKGGTVLVTITQTDVWLSDYLADVNSQESGACQSPPTACHLPQGSCSVPDAATGQAECAYTLDPLLTDTDGDKTPDLCDDDDDGDGKLDAVDNCPLVANADQLDTDGDQLGNVCDDDDDGDTIPDAADDCPLVQNTDQLDTDGDKQGNACDDNDDGDTIPDAGDNCPLVVNPDQTDTDGDKQGDACDTDDDGDGIADDKDNCPLVANADQADADGDKVGDACDSSGQGGGGQGGQASLPDLWHSTLPAGVDAGAGGSWAGAAGAEASGAGGAAGSPAPPMLQAVAPRTDDKGCSASGRPGGGAWAAAAWAALALAGRRRKRREATLPALSLAQKSAPGLETGPGRPAPGAWNPGRNVAKRSPLRRPPASGTLAPAPLTEERQAPASRSRRGSTTPPSPLGLSLSFPRRLPLALLAPA